ncbi:MAG: lactate utilization protein [Cyclobacteriaceae bacterium]
MNSSLSRKNTLNRIATALRESTGIPFADEDGFHSIFTPDQKDLGARFAHEFTIHEGKVFFCSGKKELFNHLKALVELKKWTNISCETTVLLKGFHLERLPFINKGSMCEADAGITDCECLVARTGTVVLTAAQSSGRVLPVRVPVHIVIANVNQLVFDIGQAIDRIKEKFPDRLPSALFFASGPSRTGDIERTLVVGVHGPREVYVFLMNDNDLANERIQ